MNLRQVPAMARRAPRVTIRAVACSVALILPSCGIPSLRPAMPGPDLPANYHGEAISGAASLENSSRLGIDEFFNDPILTQMISQALAGNQELRILDQEIEIANNEILARRGAYLPFVTTRAGIGLNKPSDYTPEGAVEDQLEYAPGKRFPNPLADFLVGLNVIWQVDIWRELRNARDAATQRYIAASERRNYFVTRLVAEVAENYYELMALDSRLAILDQTIKLQQESLKVAEANKAAARGTELGVQRFRAEVFKNQSEKLIVHQEIIEVENRINSVLGRFPQAVERATGDFINLNLRTLSAGVPAQLLQNRPDIREAERELVAAGLDINVARAHFFPRLDITAGIGYQAFNPRYLFNTPQALIYNAAGDLVAPLINKKAIQAEYLSANARQLQSVYNYQRVIINAVTQVINRLSKVENYRKSIEVKKQQLASLEASVDIASKLFINARAEYVEVLLAQRDMMEAKLVLVETKKQQLAAIVNAYQALGGGDLMSCPLPNGHLEAPQPVSPPQAETLPAPQKEKNLP